MVVYVLPAQLLEESGLVDRDSGHGGGIRNAMKFWKGEKTMLLASAQRQEDASWNPLGKRDFEYQKNTTQA